MKAQLSKFGWLGFAVWISFCLIAYLLTIPIRAAVGQENSGHARYHTPFYSKLQRPDADGSCCSNSDCQPTEGRLTKDGYEMVKEGRWVIVPASKIVRVSPPDGGYHICAPKSSSRTFSPDYIFCAIVPSGS